ncbi:MAG TPA: phospholipase D-like domain-containing protein, partial [Candidatus Paceibacterota bacterium]
SDATALTGAANMTTLHVTNWAGALADACERASKSITISAISMFPPLRNSEAEFSRLWRAWVSAAARGVTVLIFLPTPQPAHPATMRNASAAAIAYKSDIQCRFIPGPRLLHAKSIVIDGEQVWIGSGNMTAAAALTNHEFYVQFESRECATRIEQYLDNIANQR